jgi:hypothetical protein
MKRNADTTSQSSTPKPQTAKEVIAANVQSLIDQLEAVHSEALTTTASATSLKLHGRNRMQPGLLDCTHGISLAAG